RVYRTYLQALRLLANPPLRLIENGAISQLKQTSCSNINKRIFRGVGRVCRFPPLPAQNQVGAGSPTISANN
ncbi:hypothetical protein, partial [Microcoleus sp. AT13-A5]|uniref:hypothetical protein n=1 Tax=Microcoleus sp. AT13-A5 TaxID=2818590 RepID=UPI002FCEEE40